jgi:DNA transformation protein
VTRELAALKNLGPTTARMLREAGIETPEALREVGAPLAYRILRHRFGKARVNALYLFAMEGALQNRHWNSFTPGEKAALRDAAAGDLEAGPG